jgi:hypothetical protein
MLDLVKIEDVHPLSRGKSGKQKGKKFSKVEDVMEPYIKWLKEELEFEEKQCNGSYDDGYIYMDIDKTRERLGLTYKYHNDEALRKALKYVLLKQDIFLKIDTQHDGKKVFKMKFIKKDVGCVPIILPL